MTDLSNILGQETIKKIYEDGASEPTKEIGKVATDILSVAQVSQGSIYNKLLQGDFYFLFTNNTCLMMNFVK